MEPEEYFDDNQYQQEVDYKQYMEEWQVAMGEAETEWNTIVIGNVSEEIKDAWLSGFVKGWFSRSRYES